MASWYSNILTKTSSQISSLRSTLLSSEADGDSDDDTHVCRALRNYYTDKGRPLPPWLPPDPKAAAPAPAQPLYSQPQPGSRYGGLASNTNAGPGAALSSLWDPAPAQPPQPPSVPQSLRVGRPPAPAPAPAQLPASGRDDTQPRPLPSQRAGSYQSVGTPSPQPAGSSAQERLRNRLWGGGSGSSRTSSPAAQQAPFAPPSAAAGPADRFSPAGGDGYGPGPGPGAPGVGGGRQGLPSGPRRQGLPNGPRGYR